MDLEGAWRAYESAEQRFLVALNRGHTDLAALAHAVHVAADDCQKCAWPLLFAMRAERGAEDVRVKNVELEAEKAELLSELWRDLADAYSGNYRPIPLEP